jgi:hypothetical protein
MWLLVVMTYVGPVAPMTPVPVDRYPSHEACDDAGKEWRKTAPPDPRAVWFWSACIPAGVMQAAVPEPAPETKRKGLLGLLW